MLQLYLGINQVRARVGGNNLVEIPPIPDLDEGKRLSIFQAIQTDTLWTFTLEFEILTSSGSDTCSHMFWIC